MKSVKFSEEQLKDLVKGKSVVVVELVKKGELIKDNKLVIGKMDGIIEGVLVVKEIKDKISNKKMLVPEKMLFEVGELVQAVNEKGNWEWFCDKCNAHHETTLQNKNPESLMLIEAYCTNNHIAFEMKPLLVRLKKIEKEKFGELIKENGAELDVSRLPKEKQKSTKEFVENFECWFKTWRLNK